MIGELSRTPLWGWHENRGARLVDFGGWEMPLWYPDGAVSEHLRVVTGCGLFDTGHMAVVSVSGSGAFQLLQRCFAKDLAALKPGRCAYGVFLKQGGGVIDDAIVYRFGDHDWMIVVNAGMGPGIAAHLEANRGDLEVGVRDLTGRVGKMDLQGPLAWRIAGRMLEDAESVLSGLPYFSFKGHFDPGRPEAVVRVKSGPPVLLSRTGYTGELGFEIFTAVEDSVAVWEAVLKAGGDDLGPCGLASRDSLRAGAVLPLSHQDIGPWPFINNPWTFALPFDRAGTGFTKPFLGDAVLGMRDSADHTYAFAGKDPRKVALSDPDFGPALVLDESGREIGRVLTCVADMAVGRVDGRIVGLNSPDRPEGYKPKGLGCGFILVRSTLAMGDKVLLKDKRRQLEAWIVDDIRPGRTARLKPDRIQVL